PDAPGRGIVAIFSADEIAAQLPLAATQKIARCKPIRRNFYVAKLLWIHASETAGDVSGFNLNRFGNNAFVDDLLLDFDRYLVETDAIGFFVQGPEVVDGFVDIILLHRAFQWALEEADDPVGDEKADQTAESEAENAAEQANPEFFQVLAERHRAFFEQVVGGFFGHAVVRRRVPRQLTLISLKTTDNCFCPLSNLVGCAGKQFAAAWRRTV